MNTVKVELNDAGIRALLKSPEVKQDLKRRGDAIDQAAGGGHEVDQSETKQRARVAVVANTPETMLREAQSRSLTAAVDAGR